MQGKLFSQKPIVLASSSAIRQKLLASLGINFKIESPMIDENKYKSLPINANELALKLANAKARKISQSNPDFYVIGCDQVCDFSNKIMSKPLNKQNTINQLLELQGKHHQLISAISIWFNNQNLWQHSETAVLTMRQLSKDIIERYVELDKPYHSCGGYYYELNGKFLFEQVVGIEDTILGLPITPLLNALFSLNICQFNSAQSK